VNDSIICFTLGLSQQDIVWESRVYPSPLLPRVRRSLTTASPLDAWDLGHPQLLQRSGYLRISTEDLLPLISLLTLLRRNTFFNIDSLPIHNAMRLR
jgi:hypothetical protein